MIFDRQLVDNPSAGLFSPEFLCHKNAASAIASGRGEAFFFHYQGQEWVLRHYRRGGLISRFNSDTYFGFKPETSRAWQEFQLLAQMSSMGLPVPRPVAARAIMNNGIYTADLITVRIPDSSPLGEVLQRRPIKQRLWFEIGACLRHFHDCGVYHADLNAQNILIDHENKVYLIDFDRCSIKKSTWWKKFNLARLKRSLDKFLSNSTQFNYHPADWDSLCNGYQLRESDIRSL